MNYDYAENCCDNEETHKAWTEREEQQARLAEIRASLRPHHLYISKKSAGWPEVTGYKLIGKTEVVVDGYNYELTLDDLEKIAERISPSYDDATSRTTVDAWLEDQRSRWTRSTT